MSNIKDYTGNAMLREYLNALGAEVGFDGLNKLLKGEISYSDTAPFLSVIMRTRGNRPEALTEVLLCLSGQTDLDFEVLIMGHNLDDKGRDSVNTIIGDLPDYMNGKVRLVEVTGGNRTMPLSRGFEAASGRYISILDDDDLVFDNWVEAFHSLEAESSGKILHSYCAAQDWQITENYEGKPVLTSVSGFRTVYCQPFQMVEQLSTNRCPTFSLAFPSYVYNVLNIRFDESLTTTEDWDFLMRCAFICGVADTKEVTGIYRMWVNAESSATLHSNKEWNKNHSYVQDKFTQKALLVPGNELEGLMYSADSAIRDNAKIRETMVLIDDGSGFGTHKPLKLEFSCENGRWTVKCTDIAKYKGIVAVRLDPVASGTVTLTSLSARFMTADGKTVDYKIHKPRTNGVFWKGNIVFLGNDPQVKLELESKSDLASAELSFEILYDTPEKFFKGGIVKYLGKRWLLDAYRGFRMFTWKITHIGK